MKTITVRVRDPDLSRAMAEMRAWLDRNGYAPGRFGCDHDADVVVVSVSFQADAEADAFAARFAGLRLASPFAEGIVG